MIMGIYMPIAPSGSMATSFCAVCGWWWWKLPRRSFFCCPFGKCKYQKIVISKKMVSLTSLLVELFVLLVCVISVCHVVCVCVDYVRADLQTSVRSTNIDAGRVVVVMARQKTRDSRSQAVGRSLLARRW